MLAIVAVNLRLLTTRARMTDQCQ